VMFSVSHALHISRNRNEGSELKLLNQPSSALSLRLVRPGIQLSEEVLVSGRLL
jgi:hypothetical protein